MYDNLPDLRRPPHNLPPWRARNPPLSLGHAWTIHSRRPDTCWAVCWPLAWIPPDGPGRHVLLSSTDPTLWEDDEPDEMPVYIPRWSALLLSLETGYALRLRSHFYPPVEWVGNLQTEWLRLWDAHQDCERDSLEAWVRRCKLVMRIRHMRHILETGQWWSPPLGRKGVGQWAEQATTAYATILQTEHDQWVRRRLLEETE